MPGFDSQRTRLPPSIAAARPGACRVHSALAALLAAAGALLVLGGCAGAAAWHRPPSLLATVLLLALALVAQTGLFALCLALHERRARSRRDRDALARELALLLPIATPDAVQRKAGLLIELSARRAAPPALDGIELPGADLRGVVLSGCSLRGANLADADLQGARLDGADLFGARLTGANLSLAGLGAANLRGCALEGATLIRADLAGANLHRAELAHANLHGADLTGARLALARFALPADGATPAIPWTIHPSVDDWIRAGLDASGRYRDATPVPTPRYSRAG